MLWKIVQSLLLHNNNNHDDVGNSPRRFTCYILTQDPYTPQYHSQLLQQVQDKFQIPIHTNNKNYIHFVHCPDPTHLLQPSFQSFSLFRESLAKAVWSYRALNLFFQNNHININHIIWWDTMGCASTFLVAYHAFRIPHIWTYVHYPTLQNEDLQHKQNQKQQSILYSIFKSIYYWILLKLYAYCGSYATAVWANSTWTGQHLQQVWNIQSRRRPIQILYPPCSTTTINHNNNNNNHTSKRTTYILSIAQFRPEKNHTLQLQALQLVMQQQHIDDIQLVCIGSCRHQQDQQRFNELQQFAQQHKLPVQFVVNQPYSVIQQWLAKASIGIHTMWNEHFGIGIVEMMAAGLIVVAHQSGGPMMDIITTTTTTTTTNSQEKDNCHPKSDIRTGYLATTAQEYADAILEILQMAPEEQNAIRQRAILSSQRFSDPVFAQKLQASVDELLSGSF